MKVSDAQIARTARSEGFSAHAYSDHKGDSIGFGHRILPGESFPNGVTQLEAMGLLSQDMDKVAVVLNELVPLDCTQNQYDSLADFGFNEGTNALRLLLSHGWYQVPIQILRWKYAKDKDGNEIEIPNLLARRQEELELWKA